MSSKVQAKFMLPRDKHERLRQYAEIKGSNMSAELEALIDEVITPELRDRAPELDLG